MKMTFGAMLIALMLTPVGALAQVDETASEKVRAAIRACNALIQSGTLFDRQVAGEQVEVLETWMQASGLPVDTGGECAAFARQINAQMVFSSSTGRYMSVQAKQQLAKEVTRNQLRTAKAARDTAAAKALEDAEDAKLRELYSRVYNSCVTLSERDPVAAYTNRLCVDMFSSVGLPD